MNCFKLGLPTDIPWRRICVSKDMLDPILCDSKRPPKWASSLAVFRYDPVDDYQPYEDAVVSYLKVVATVTPFAPDISAGLGGGFVPPVLIDDLEEAFPCYGAILQVTVAPPAAERPAFEPINYPYFIDFEPKKRELYESVTDTGEVLSGSSTSLAVGKSATTSDTTENYNLDTGWNFGMSGSYGGTGGGVTAGASGQTGTVDKTGLQRTDIRTSEESTERRERQSHTTQLAQMYNLFQAFHLGTNRAVFFLEPRPHIRQSEATFINGPRALEGIQEVFLVVVRPKAMKDYCVGVLLETAHLTKEPRFETETDTALLQFRLFANAKNMDTTRGETDWTETVEKSETYSPPAGWEIDTSRSGGYDYVTLRSARKRSGPVFTVTPSALSVWAECTWRFWETGAWNNDHYADGYLDLDITIYLRKKEPTFIEFIDKLYLSARDLCCCAGEREGRPPMEEPVRRVDGAWISYTKQLPAKARVMVYNGRGSKQRFLESRQVAAAVREEMVASLARSRRRDRHEVMYVDSDLFFTRLAHLMRRRRTSVLSRDLDDSGLVPKDQAAELMQAVGGASVHDLLSADAQTIARALGTDEAKVVDLKREILRRVQAPKSRTGSAGTPAKKAASKRER